MNEKNLFTIAIIIALIGILSLIYISEKVQPPFLKINNITKEYTDRQIITLGKIENIRETPGLYLINIEDETDTITIVVFKQDQQLNLSINQNIQITGKVQDYNGQLEVIADEINVI